MYGYMYICIYIYIYLKPKACLLPDPLIFTPLQTPPRQALISFEILTQNFSAKMFNFKYSTNIHT